MATTKKTTARKAAAPKPKRGNMRPTEIKPLVMAARKAYDAQAALGLTDGLSFDDWRRREVMVCVGKHGLTACDHDDYRPLLAHFQTLAGDDAAAFQNAMKTGKPTDHAAPGDTHERRRQLAFEICTTLAEHIYLATTPAEQLKAEDRAYYDEYAAREKAAGFVVFPYKGDELKKQLARKAAIEERGKGHLTAGYLVYIVRQKTRRPDLKLGQNLQDGLADRCTAHQLEQIRWTLQNRINAIEGIGETRNRNKSQRSQKAKDARREKGSDRRW